MKQKFILCALFVAMAVTATADWWETDRIVRGGLEGLNAILESQERRQQAELFAREKAKYEADFNDAYAHAGFIHLEIEIHGLNPNMTDEQFKEITAAFDRENGYLTNGLDNRDNYYMKHVYVACVRAIDFLTTLPEWDGKNVCVQGGSQGGALSLITAGLDSRVTACVANHPALSDMAGYLDNRAGGYPHFNHMNKMLTPGKVLTMAYYDVVNFARRITCPVYLTWGFNDNVCPPTTSYIVWNLITAPKDSLITPINEHWTSNDTNHAQVMWLKEHLIK